jgi:hypothetical protein
MVRITNILIYLVGVLTICVFMNLISLPCFSYDSSVDRTGYTIDMRGQYDEDTVIKPPHPENIPSTPKVQQTITSFEEYYDVNYEGYRRPEGKLPLIPEYTAHYSTRNPYPYTKQQYINVWKCGPKVGNIDCLTDEYAISFFSVEDWFIGINTAVWRARKVPQKPACFLYVDDAGAHVREMCQAKQWADLWKVKIFFGTIDQGIPVEWINKKGD